MAHHITSFFARTLSSETTFVVSRSNPAYTFYTNEYRNGLDRDPEGNLIVQKDREKLVKLKCYLDRIISKNSDAYSYFVNEYRQNSPLQDQFGNILLYDEIIESSKKL
ncbi:MAG: hypothetical protein J6W64_11280 [Bacilli bacterium]|nr:hypothetical protein [Bacilli bacterium]